MVIRQKGKFTTGVTRKQSTPNFPENEHFLAPDTQTCVCISGGKKCLFFGKFDVIYFLVTFVLRFASLPYYRRIVRLIFPHHELTTRSVAEYNEAVNKVINFMKEKDNPYTAYTKLYHLTSVQLVCL